MTSIEPVEPGDALSLARALVRVDSRNPSLVPGAPGEEAVARALCEILEGWGFNVQLLEAAPGRPNVVARIGERGGPSLMLNGHLDVVGTEGMTHPPFEPEVRGGRLYGRGAADMKSGVAAMCAATARVAARGGLAGEVIIAAVVDEEYESAGTRSLVASGVRADAAVVTEPTRLAICPAHKGFAWLDVVVHGHAAHGSRYDVGIDAIRHAGLLLAELDAYEEHTLVRHTHPLLGHASLHASHVEGGSGMSTYPDRCLLKIERRTVPGETPEETLAETRAACDRVRARRPDFRADVALTFSQEPSDVAVDAPVVRALGGALSAAGLATRIEGASYWTDAALLNAAGIPAVCFGPGDIAQAHGAEEWIELSEVERATDVLEQLIARWGR